MRTVYVVNKDKSTPPRVTAVMPRRPEGTVRPPSRINWAMTKLFINTTNQVRRFKERGDVPGWVLITLMTAGLVIAIWAVAKGALTDLFSTAISDIKTSVR